MRFDAVAAAMDAALNGSDKPPTTQARDQVVRTWPKLSAAEKNQKEARMLGLLDRYEMAVNARRPSQSALRDQYKV